jgi:hypothetical protein
MGKILGCDHLWKEAMRMRRATRVLAGSIFAVLAVAGCVPAAPAVPTVSLPKKGTTLPALGDLGPTWTPVQRRVMKAYHATQVALNSASDSQSATRARTILTPYVLPSDISGFIAQMAENWQKDDVSSGNLHYQVDAITFTGNTALVETCWPPAAFAIKSAATGKLVPPLPEKAKHSITLMGYVNGHWLQGKSVADAAPCG